MSNAVVGQAPSQLLSIAWSPDEAWIATTHDDDSVRIWNAATGLLDRTTQVIVPVEFTDDPHLVSDIEWKPDGTELAYLIRGRDHSLIQIMDAENLDVRLTLNKEGSLLSVMLDIEWSPDGALIAGGNNAGRGSAGDYNLFVWETLTGNIETDLSAIDTTIRQIAWNPNPFSQQLAFRGGTFAAIWNTSTDTVMELAGHDGPVKSMSWNGDGSEFVTFDDSTIRIWDPFSGSNTDRAVVGIGIYSEMHWLPQIEQFLALDYSDLLTLTQLDGIRNPEVNLDLGTNIYAINAASNKIATSMDGSTLNIVDLSGNPVPFATVTPSTTPTTTPAP